MSRFFYILVGLALCFFCNMAFADTENTALSPYTHKPSPKRPIPALLAVPHNMPITSSIPDQVVEWLKQGKIAAATRRLYLEPASAKNLLLIRDLERIGETQSGMRPPVGDLHRYHMNTGIAYHNVYLFLRSHNIDHKTFSKEAGKSYRRARKYSTSIHKSEVDALWASLDMIQGKTKRAERRFTKHVDEKLLKSHFRGTSYLATYYAAAGDIQGTLTALHNARRFDAHDHLKTWLLISDDFVKIRNDESFQQFLQSLE